MTMCSILKCTKSSCRYNYQNIKEGNGYDFKDMSNKPDAECNVLERVNDGSKN